MNKTMFLGAILSGVTLGEIAFIAPRVFDCRVNNEDQYVFVEKRKRPEGKLVVDEKGREILVEDEPFTVETITFVEDFQKQNENPLYFVEEEKVETVKLEPSMRIKDPDFIRDTKDLEYVEFVDFLDDSNGYLKRSWTYYEGDNVLVNHKDDVVDDPSAILGPLGIEALLFGYKSDDPSVVYILNKRLNVILEIFHDSRTSVEVLGPKTSTNFEISSKEQMKMVEKYRGETLNKINDF